MRAPGFRFRVLLASGPILAPMGAIRVLAGRDARRSGVRGGAGVLGGAEAVPAGGGGVLAVPGVEGAGEGVSEGDGGAEGGTGRLGLSNSESGR